MGRPIPMFDFYTGVQWATNNASSHWSSLSRSVSACLGKALWRRHATIARRIVVLETYAKKVKPPGPSYASFTARLQRGVVLAVFRDGMRRPELSQASLDSPMGKRGDSELAAFRH